MATWHGPPFTPYNPDIVFLDTEKICQEPYLGNRDMIEKKERGRPKKEELRTTKLVEEFPDVTFGRRLVKEVKEKKKRSQV